MANVSFVQMSPLFINRACRELKSSGNAISLAFTIAEEVLHYSYGRASLTRELSCRYLEKKTGIPYTHISEVLKDLQQKGFIQVLKKGKKKIGSLIKLLLTEEEKKALPEYRENSSVTEKVTKASGISYGKGNKQNNKFFKEKTNIDDVFSINNNDNSPPSVQQVKQNDTAGTENLPESNLFPENLPPPPSGVLPHAWRNGIKILRKRGISELAQVVERIGAEMAGRAIENINGYFTQLCKRIELNVPLVEALPRVKRVEDAAQEENNRKFQEEDKRQEKSLTDQWQELQEKYPEKTEPVKKKVDNSSMGRMVSIEILKVPLYLKDFENLYGGNFLL